MARAAHASDRRARVVDLTPDGKALITQVFATHKQAMDRAAQGLSKAERATLIALLKKLGTTADHQPVQNIFCIWRDGKPADFELKLQYRLTGANTGNSGIQYRSIDRPDVAQWVLEGYQADIDANQTYTGQIYEERGRGFLALRGMFSYIPGGKKVGSVSSLGDAAELKNFIKVEDWNEMHIIARGNTIIQIMNGHVMSMLIDDDTAGRRMSGLIGIQLHRTPGPLKIEAKNIATAGLKR